MRKPIHILIVIILLTIGILASSCKKPETSRVAFLRQYYSELSVQQSWSMSRISIREKEMDGFSGHSTIRHSYDLKSINGNVVVIDHATGLMWHQSGSEKDLVWKEAKQWVKDFNSRGYAGYNDWRLPTAEEAASLLESSKNNNGLYIDPLFSNRQEWIWTGDVWTDSINNLMGAWNVYFGRGHLHLDIIRSDLGVRPVRSMK